MEINIQIKTPDKLGTNVLIKQSAFISCDYNPDIVDYIRNLRVRAYNPEDKSWEIPLSCLADFCNKFIQHTVIIEGIYTDSNIKETLMEIPDSYTFKTKPYPHQIDGIKYALTKNKFLLGDDQGLGKTKQIIDWVSILKHQSKVKRALIICGVNSLKYNWQQEILVHSNLKSWVLGTRYRKNGNVYEGSAKDKLADLKNLPDCTFLITNIETLRAGGYKQGNKYIFPVVEELKRLIKSGEISLLALDEAHKCKNPNSLQGRALLKLQAEYMVAMSGTFLMNNPLDLYSPLNWTSKINNSFYAFKNHYCTLGGFGGQEITGYKNLGEVREMLDAFMLRRLKNEVVDLPPKIHQVDYVEMTPKQAVVYKEVLAGVKAEIDKIKFSNNPLAMLIKLRQATGYTGILSTKVEESAKLDRMEELVEELNESGKKVIIFSNWEQITTQAKNRLNKYKPAYITGDTKATDRMNEIDKFQNGDCNVIIGTIGAMGTGLTLNKASTVIFLDEPWNRALKDQAEDRAHRIGTAGTVNIITLITKNTIDERINEIVYQKGLLSDILIDGTGGKVDMNIINQLIN